MEKCWIFKYVRNYLPVAAKSLCLLVIGCLLVISLYCMYDVHICSNETRSVHGDKYQYSINVIDIKRYLCHAYIIYLITDVVINSHDRF